MDKKLPSGFFINRFQVTDPCPLFEDGVYPGVLRYLICWLLSLVTRQKKKMKGKGEGRKRERPRPSEDSNDLFR